MLSRSSCCSCCRWCVQSYTDLWADAELLLQIAALSRQAEGSSIPPCYSAYQVVLVIQLHLFSHFPSRDRQLLLTLAEQAGKTVIILDFSQHLSLIVTCVSQPQGQALRDVEKALQIFENTRKIPTSVIEARYCVLLNSSCF